VLLSSEGQVRGTAGKIGARLTPFLASALVPGKPIGLHREAGRVFDTAFASVGRAEDASLVPFTLGSPDEKVFCFGAVLTREAFPSGLVAAFGLAEVWTEPLFAMVLLSARDTHAAGRLVHRNFGLTTAESRLAAKLLQGRRISDAAADLGMTASTARWHLRNIFSKTGTRRQADLLRLLTNASEFPEHSPSAQSMALPGIPPRRLVTLEDGRRLFYREYGVPGGVPVIYFHFGLSASMLPPAAAAAALKTGVRVIAFERPGFGLSDPRKEYSLAGVASDVDELRRALGLTRVGLFGDGYGGGFAVTAAQRLEGSVNRLALHAPNLGWPATNGENRNGFSVLYSQPWIIPTAAEMLRRGLRIPVIRSLLGYLGEKSRSDASRLSDPAFSAYLNTTIFEALERSSKGLASELMMFGKGARSDPAGLKCPIAVWHGDENAVVPLADSVADFDNHPMAELHVLKGVGLYLRQPAFEAIFGWLGGTDVRRGGFREDGVAMDLSGAR
jgi:pimeloyl-ACP methyl ester carboxylesterase/DNA-binding CsgD family transcriptional regulator